MSFTSAPPAFRPRWSDVYLASTARAISVCGDFLAATALALTLQTNGDSGYGVAALMLAAVLPLALFGSVAGKLADRVDSRTLLVTVGLTQAAICATLAFTTSTVAMVLLVALLSTGAAINQPTLGALTPDMVGAENLGKAAAISQTASSIGMLAGPALGGLLVGAYGTRVPLLIDAVSFIAIAVAGVALRTRRGGRTVSKPAVPDEARPDAEAAAPARGWRLRDDPLLAMLVTAFAVVLGTVTAFEVAEIFFVRETLGSTASMYGVVAASWTAGLLLGAWPFSRVKGSDEKLARVLLFALAACSLMIALSAGVWTAVLLVPLYLLGGFFNAALNVITGVVLGRRAPAAMRGQVFGVFGAVANTASMVGYVAAGPLLQVLSPRAMIAGGGLLSLSVALAFLLPRLAKRGSETEVQETGVREPAAAVGYGSES